MSDLMFSELTIDISNNKYLRAYHPPQTGSTSITVTVITDSFYLCCLIGTDLTCKLSSQTWSFSCEKPISRANFISSLVLYFILIFVSVCCIIFRVLKPGMDKLMASLQVGIHLGDLGVYAAVLLSTLKEPIVYNYTLNTAGTLLYHMCAIAGFVQMSALLNHISIAPIVGVVYMHGIEKVSHISARAAGMSLVGILLANILIFVTTYLALYFYALDVLSLTNACTCILPWKDTPKISYVFPTIYLCLTFCSLLLVTVFYGVAIRRIIKNVNKLGQYITGKVNMQIRIIPVVKHAICNAYIPLLAPMFHSCVYLFVILNAPLSLNAQMMLTIYGIPICTIFYPFVYLIRKGVQLITNGRT